MSKPNLPTEKQVYDRLKTVIDPELGIDIVSLGLIYEVTVKEIQTEGGKRPFIHIVMTLTTPGCPLAHVFDGMLRGSLDGLEGVDNYKDVEIELTFDPPWLPDMMTEEAKAELNMD